MAREKEQQSSCAEASSHQPSVTPQGTPVLKRGALNVYATMPCPLKVRLKAEFEAFMEQYNREHAQPIYCRMVRPKASRIG